MNCLIWLTQDHFLLNDWAKLQASDAEQTIHVRRASDFVRKQVLEGFQNRFKETSGLRRLLKVSPYEVARAIKLLGSEASKSFYYAEVLTRCDVYFKEILRNELEVSYGAFALPERLIDEELYSLDIDDQAAYFKASKLFGYVPRRMKEPDDSWPSQEEFNRFAEAWLNLESFIKKEFAAPFR